MRRTVNSMSLGQIPFFSSSDSDDRKYESDDTKSLSSDILLDYDSEGTSPNVFESTDEEILAHILLREVRSSVRHLLGTEDDQVDDSQIQPDFNGDNDDSGMGFQIIDDQNEHLRNFCDHIERILCHGFKEKGGIFNRRNQSYWNYMPHIQHYMPESTATFKCINSLNHIKTASGKGRAWIRFALIEKRLAEYFQVLIDNQDFREKYLIKYYTPKALLRHKEQSAMLLGMLMPLKLVNFNLCLKDFNFDENVMEKPKTPSVSEGAPTTKKRSQTWNSRQLKQQFNHFNDNSNDDHDPSVVQNNRHSWTNTTNNNHNHNHNNNYKQQSDVDTVDEDTDSVDTNSNSNPNSNPNSMRINYGNISSESFVPPVGSDESDNSNSNNPEDDSADDNDNDNPNPNSNPSPSDTSSTTTALFDLPGGELDEFVVLDQTKESDEPEQQKGFLVAVLESRITELINSLNLKTLELDQLKHDHNLIFDSMKLNVEKMQKEKEQNSKALKELNQQWKDLTLQLAGAQQEVAEKNEIISTLNANIEEIVKGNASKLEVKEKEVCLMVNEMKKLDVQVIEKDKKNKELQFLAFQMRSELEAMEEEKKQLQQQLQEKDDKLKLLEEASQKKLSELEHKHKNELKMMEQIYATKD